MNGAVHYGLTRRWALEEGFSADDAETIARADVGVDRIHSGHDWHNWGWHFALAGAWARSRRLLRHAVERGDLVALGESLHCLQDSIGHGVVGHVFHWPGIDIWERRSARMRALIEKRTRTYLRAYGRIHPDEGVVSDRPATMP